MGVFEYYGIQESSTTSPTRMVAAKSDLIAYPLGQIFNFSDAKSYQKLCWAMV